MGLAYPPYQTRFSNDFKDIKRLLKRQGNMPTFEKPSNPLQTLVREFDLISSAHRKIVCDIPTLKLFKSFATTLYNADSSLIILPYQLAKQHYSTLTNIKQIQTIAYLRLLQFFKPYYQKQQYSLSGYFHVLSTLTFDQFCTIPKVEEWLDTYNYFFILCPSQSEEMTQIGALCYSNLFIYREDLKAAILSRTLQNLLFCIFSSTNSWQMVRKLRSYLFRLNNLKPKKL
jgi:hypothetical protein